MDLFVSNVKCGGCSTTIKNAVLGIEGVEFADVNIEAGSVSFTPDSEELSEKIHAKLSKLGYPKEEDNNAIQKAKSYIACALGRVSD